MEEEGGQNCFAFDPGIAFVVRLVPVDQCIVLRVVEGGVERGEDSLLRGIPMVFSDRSGSRWE